MDPRGVWHEPTRTARAGHAGRSAGRVHRRRRDRFGSPRSRRRGPAPGRCSRRAAQTRRPATRWPASLFRSSRRCIDRCCRGSTRARRSSSRRRCRCATSRATPRPGAIRRSVPGEPRRQRDRRRSVERPRRRRAVRLRPGDPAHRRPRAALRRECAGHRQAARHSTSRSSAWTTTAAASSRSCRSRSTSPTSNNGSPRPPVWTSRRS